MLYKMYNSLVDVNYHQYLIPARRQSRHLHKYAYKVPASLTNYHQFSFFPRTVRDWNSLPLAVVEAKSVSSFLDHMSN